VLHQVHLGFAGNAANLGMLLTINDVSFGRFIKGRVQQNAFDNILDLFHLQGVTVMQFVGQRQHSQGHFLGLTLTELFGGTTGFGDGCGDLRCVELNNSAVTFFYLLDHGILLGHNDLLWWHETTKKHQKLVSFQGDAAHRRISAACRFNPVGSKTTKFFLTSRY
jgi:hypothetical protein